MPSGQMQEIGFDLYAQLLDRAVRAYRPGDIPNLDMAEDQGCQIDLGINKIEASSVNIRLTFNDKPNFDPAKLITEIQRHPKLYKLEGAKRLIYTVATETAEERIEQVMGLVEKLGLNNSY